MLAAVLALAAVICAAVALRPAPRHAGLAGLARMSTMDPRELARERSGNRPVWERLVQPLVSMLAPRMRGNWAGLGEGELRTAGIDPERFGVAELMVMKLLGALAGAALVIALSTLAPGAVVLLPAVAFGGFIAPSLVVRRRKRARQEQLLRELPDLVGLLKAFVTAGIPLEQGLHLISQQQARCAVPNLLAHEVRVSLSDYGLGLPIEVALERMAERVGIEELSMLAAALAQGKRLGTGMEAILRDQETVVRLQQRNRATAQASKVGTRLVGILVFVYLPEFMLLIMVPLFWGIFLRAFN